MKDRDTWLRDTQAMINFLGAHPELELPDITATHYSWSDDKAAVRATARALGTFEKKFSEYSITLSKSFGSIRLSYTFSRTGICKSVKVGTKKEKRSRAVSYIEEEVEVPIYEYECPSLMDLEVEETDDQEA